MNKTLLAVATLALTGPMAAHADTILGVYASAGKWNQDYSGQIGTAGGDVIDLQDDLGLDDDSGQTMSIALEHPVPFLPNVRLSSTKLENDATNTLTRSVEYEDQIFSINADVHTELDLSHKDYLLYYEILDNWVTVDLGLNIRKFDGKISLTDVDNTANHGEATLEGNLPMLYGRLEFQLPLTGLSLGAEMMGISAGDATIKDIKLRAAYESSIGIGVEVGQRTFTIDYEPDDPDADEVIADIEFKGSYAAVTYHF